MSVFVDYRVGSIELLEPLQKAGLAAEKTTLEFGDFAFVGRGANDKPLNIGIERKRLSDLVGSLRSDRLSGHQLPGMLGPEGSYDLAWIVVEGLYRVGSRGEILVKQKHKGSRLRRPEWVPLPGGTTASEMEKRVLTFELCGGCHVRYTNSPEDTVHFLVNLYRWFCDRSFDQHRSHLRPHDPPDPQIWAKKTLARDIAQKLPGIGWKKATSVAAYFKTPLNMIQASPVEWSKIEGIGLPLAKQIHQALRCDE